MQMPCVEKADIWRYCPGAIPIGPFEGHGLVLVRSGQEIGLGVVAWYCDTLIETTGGTFIEPGDLLVHDPLWCLKGRERAAS